MFNNNKKPPINYPTIGAIAKAFENDPRTKLGIQALAQGTSSAPVAGYGYGTMDGIGRIMQGVLGGYMAKKGLQRADANQNQYMADYQAAMGRAFPATPEGVDAIAGALGGARSAPNPFGGTTNPGVAPQGPQRPLAGQKRPFPSAPSSNTAPVADRGGADPYLSYKSSAYDGIEERVAAEVGIPKQLISSIRLFGERSNANQVSSANARTVYQVIPSTRAAFLKKYGIDAYASPENAAKVAALHLKESLDRNNGDHGAAIGEYIGGPNRNNWGKITNAYIRRVTGGLNANGMPAPTSPPLDTAQAPLDMPEFQASETLPEKPKAEDAVQSRRLRLAEQLIGARNPFFFDDARAMLEAGMAEQNTNDEEATKRKQSLTDTEYQAGLTRYAQQQQDLRQDTLNARNSVREDTNSARQASRGYSYQNALDTSQRAFQASENAKSRAQEQAQFEQTMKLEREKIDASRLTQQEKAEAKKQAFLTNPTGWKITNDALGRINSNAGAIATLDAFAQRQAQTRTGGLIRGNAPGLVSWGDSDLQVLDSLSNLLVLTKTGDMKGALSDKDVLFLTKVVPSIRQTKSANNDIIRHARNLLQRANDFEQARLEAFAQGDQVNFSKEWSAYSSSVDSNGEYTSFDEWKAKRPKFDASGRKVQ